MTGALHLETAALVSSNTDTPHTDPFLGRTIDGKYLIEQRIGRGGSGTVYRARHTLIHRPVAIKLLSLDLVADPDSLERFRREAQTAGNVKHVYLVPVTDFGMTPDGIAYLVMDFIEGGTLRKILDREKTLPLDRVVRIMKAVCSGMHAVHRKGIVHRDLKPDNVMIEVVDEEEMPRVLDFGIAKLLDAFGGATNEFRTETGSVMGTPHYMSPEQCEGKTLDVRSDIYSLGVLAYEMLVGTVPFPGKTSASIMMQQVTKEPPPLRQSRPDLSEAAEACILRALAKEPAARHATTIDFFLELEAALAVPEKGAIAPEAVRTASPENDDSPVLPLDPLEKAKPSPSGNFEKVSGFVTELQKAAAKAAPLKEEITEKFFNPPQNEKKESKLEKPQTEKPVLHSIVSNLDPFPAVPAPPTPRVKESLSAKTPNRNEIFETTSEAKRRPEPVPPSRKSAVLQGGTKQSPPARRKTPPPAPLTPHERRRLIFAWTRRGAAAAAFGVVAYAVIMFAAQRRIHADLEARCGALLRDPSTNIATLRDQVKATLRERGITIPEKSLRIQADPPNHRVAVHIDYVRPILSIPLQYRIEQGTSNYPLPISAVANIKPTEVELVNTSRREIERYRIESQRRAAHRTDPLQP